MTKEYKSQAERRAEILERYALAESPEEANRLARAWLDAGGKEIMNDAIERGLSGFKTEENDGDR